MALLLGIDLGTSYFKVGVFDESGTLRGLGRVAVDKLTPGPGRFELPVDAFWGLLRRALAEALALAQAPASKIVALSYSSQANTFVLLDHGGTPLTPLVFWTDTRGEPVEENLQAFSRRAAFRRTAGFDAISSQSAVSKWRWFQKNEPALSARVRWWMTISDYFTFALTGEPAGDASTAALLGLYHLQERRWWTEALAAAGIESERMVTPLMPGSPCGRTVARATDLLGVPAGIPFAVGGLDHHIAALGSGLGRFADLSISTGTVLAAICLVDRVAPVPGCYHGPHVDGTRYYRLAFDPAGAGQLDDFQRRFAPEQSIESLIAMAAAIAPLQRPAGEPFSSAWAGEPGAAVRYLLEKVGIAHRGLIRRVAQGQTVETISATGGGANSAIWLSIKADILNVRIVTPSGAERACLGAAALAAVAAGIYSSIGEAVLAMVRPDRVFEPNPSNVAFYRDARLSRP